MVHTAHVEWRASRYEPGMERISLCASNGYWSGAVNVYAYTDDIAGFCNSLLNYDGTNVTSVVWELGGKEETAAYYLGISIYPIDSLGHSVLNIEMQDRYEHFRHGSCA